MKCPLCKCYFVAVKVNQKFCSHACQAKAGNIKRRETGEEKIWEKRRRDSLPDSMVKKAIYIASKGVIKYNQITPEMITIKREQILTYRQRQEERKIQPPKDIKRICIVCGTGFDNVMPNAKYCSKECNISNQLKKLRDKYKAAWQQPAPFNCKHCGKEVIIHYGETRDVYCSNRCQEKDIRNNLAYKRRVRYKENYKEHVSKAYICKRDNWICHICGKPVDKHLKNPDLMSASLDHIIPLSKNGIHAISNVKLAHMICNSYKRDLILKEYGNNVMNTGV